MPCHWLIAAWQLLTSFPAPNQEFDVGCRLGGHYTVYASIANARPIGLGNWPVEFSLLRGAPPKTAKPRQPLHALHDCQCDADEPTPSPAIPSAGNIHYSVVS